MRRYLVGVTIALDQLANAILMGRPTETVSVRSAVARDQGKRWGCVLCRLLDVFHRNHCDTSKRATLTAAAVTIARIHPEVR